MLKNSPAPEEMGLGLFFYYKSKMIQVKGLTKAFGKKKVVDNISFDVDKGEVLGFLGPNAAGKTTTMRMITGFLIPTSGTAIVGGHDILNDPLNVRKKMGYLPENAPVYPDMTVYGFLDFIAEIRGFSGREKRERVGDIIERCFLEDVKYQSISILSKGFKQRVCLAQSLIHDPEYLVLDEPTDGLDPNQKHEVRNMIKEMAREKAIILSTHILEEMEAVCTRAIIIANGRIMADDTPEGLKARSSMYGAVRVNLQAPAGEQLINRLKGLSGVKDVVVDDRSLLVYPEKPGPDFVDMVISYLRSNDLPILSYFVEQGRIDEVFRKITLGDGGLH